MPANPAHRVFWRRSLLSISLLWCYATSAAAVERTPDRHQLEGVRARIEAVQKRLEATREERDELREQLREVERDMGEATFALNRTSRALRAAVAEQARLQQRERAQQAQLETHRRALAAYVRAAYLSRTANPASEPLRLVLQQQHVGELGRLWVYHGYVARARATRIGEIARAAQDLATLRRTVAQRAAELAALRADQARGQAALARAHAQQKTVLAQLSRRVKTQSEILAELRRDEQRLSRLVRDVRQSLAEVPAAVPSFPRGSFSALKGKLAPPVPMKINAAYGSAKGGRHTDVRWKGVLLAAKPGQEVRAVYPGRVVYADWLRGFGLLLILEHGEGYMTLYGHGQSLYKKPGELVEAGEIIAVAGNTGGFPEPGLYFELRHHGEPRNPVEWFAR